MRTGPVILPALTTLRRRSGKLAKKLAVLGVPIFVLEITRRIGGFIASLIQREISRLIILEMLQSEDLGVAETECVFDVLY